MTTPRDAIGLSERLRAAHPNSMQRINGSDILLEAATQLEALHKELAQTQAHLAIRNGDLAEAVRERDSHQERVKELKAERSSWRETLRIERDCTLKATRLKDKFKKERDEALERLKPFASEAADIHPECPNHTLAHRIAFTVGELRAARDLVLRLAAGPDNC